MCFLKTIPQNDLTLSRTQVCVCTNHVICNASPKFSKNRRNLLLLFFLDPNGTLLMEGSLERFAIKSAKPKAERPLNSANIIKHKHGVLQLFN